MATDLTFYLDDEPGESALIGDVLGGAGVKDRPGALGEIVHKLGAAKINLEIAYLATNTRLVLGADNLAEAEAALA